jgi:hypothetical protein
MRLPDEILECVGFIGVQVVGDGVSDIKLGGTGFFVSLPSKASDNVAYVYFVTAKHCIAEAERLGKIFIRLNTVNGEYEYIPVRDGWLYPEDPSVDLAVLPFAPDHTKFQYKHLDHTVLADQQKCAEHKIGIGEELCISGLFTRRVGRGRNIPVVRFGNIAAMPSEPLPDSKTGLSFHAYLAEVRSIGGLSGSPVFVWLGPSRVGPDGTLNLSQRFMMLLGVVRGHWEHQEPEPVLSAWTDEFRKINWGIGTITPANELAAILFGQDLVAKRQKKDEELAQQAAEAGGSS